MSFGMIFAIVAGAFILALAIYAVVKFANSAEKKIEGETSKTIGILTNPLESSFESSTTVIMSTPVPTRIYTGCFFEEPDLFDVGVSYVPGVVSKNFVSPNNELLLVDEIFVYTESNSDETAHGFKYWQGNYLSQFPQDWSDYKNGEFEIRFEVLSQPTYTPSKLQFGIWQDGSIGSCGRETMSTTADLTEIIAAVDLVE